MSAEIPPHVPRYEINLVDPDEITFRDMMVGGIGVWQLVCNTCGAVVYDRALHVDFHTRLRLGVPR